MKCAASFDNLHRVRRSALMTRAGDTLLLRTLESMTKPDAVVIAEKEG